MKRIRGGSGIGDSIYLRPIVEHFVKQDGGAIVCSSYPDVFIGSGAEVVPFARNNIDVLGHYAARRHFNNTNQYEDVCGSAGVNPELKFDWTVQNSELVQKIKAMADGKPIVLVHGGRVPMGRTDGVGSELLPDGKAFAAALAALKDCFLVRIGKGEQLYPLTVDCDLNDQTSVSDLLDLAYECDGIIAQCSFAIPLAEVFNKLLLVVWASRGLDSRIDFVRQTTPKKILSKATSHYVVDDMGFTIIQNRASFWLHSVDAYARTKSGDFSEKEFKACVS